MGAQQRAGAASRVAHSCWAVPCSTCIFMHLQQHRGSILITARLTMAFVNVWTRRNYVAKANGHGLGAGQHRGRSRCVTMVPCAHSDQDSANARARTRTHTRTPQALVPTGDVTSFLYAPAHRPPTSHGFGGQQRFFLQSPRERRRLSRLRVRQPHGACGACSVACDAATLPALPCVTSGRKQR